MALLMLPLITFVAFRDGAANIGINKHLKQQNNLLFLENLKIINGTELILECPPASILVRQHMAPDFEHPQLVRKLNWFFEGVLVASFQQQELGADIEQQLWTNNERLLLKRPFFELRIFPVLPKDNGEWICILETDPLFAEELPLQKAGAKLLVRAENTVGESQFGPEAVFKTFGLPPSKSAEIRSLINSTSADCVELEWQQPIIEEDGEESTSDSILGYRIIVNKLDGTNLKEIYAKGSNTQKQLVCSLEPFTDYSLTLEAHNLFGYSKATKTSFKTEQSIPSGPPLSVQVLPLPGGTSLSLNWRQPEKPNGIIRAYLIHFKEMFSQRPLRQIRLEAKNEEENDEELSNRDQLKQSSITDKGEGPKSEPIIVDTDIAVPQESPKITSLFFDCASSLLSLEWILPQNLLNSKFDGFHKISIYSLMTQTLLLDQIQLGEQLTLSVSILLKSKANSSILLETPSSSQEHFVLLANGWKCRYRSSICPPINLITSKSICENFPKTAANQKIQEEIKTTTLIPSIQNKQNYNNIKMDANMATIFFIFGTAIALAIFLLFLCMLRRYTDIGAFPKESRIRLYCTEKERYINANFVDSCDEKHAYIATQAPLPNTFGDFWLMVWQEKCQLLIAIINMVECGFRKCDQYWPEEIGEKILIENFCIKLVAERSNSVFTHRVLEIKNNLIENGEENIRTTHQLHFMDWPDKGVPSTPFPLLHFINYVADLHCSSQNQDISSSTTPCVVHCSAGIGRSGSFILVDSLRRHLLCCDRIDVSEQLKRMRKQRIQLVQTLEQFVFCHEVLKHLVSNGITRRETPWMFYYGLLHTNMPIVVVGQTCVKLK
uniref:Protein-tyrosine-phosphatase n=1 Tax=Meloidogyne javanica TaxID=6303 RepID=A0A915NBR5_MELJA